MLEKTKMLWRFMEGQRLRYFGAIGAMLASTLAGYVAPMITGTVIDYVVQGKAMRGPALLSQVIEILGGRSVLAKNLWLGSLGVIFFTSLAGACGYLRARLSATASESISRRLRDRLYDHLQRLPCSYHDKAETGDLVQRCTSDVETVRGFFAGQVVEIARAIIMVVTVLPFMLFMSVPLTLLAMVMIPVISLFSFIFFSRVKRTFKAADESEGKMTTVLQENLTGIRVVRAFARQDFECEKFAGDNATFRDKNFDLIKLLSIYWSSSDCLTLLQHALVLIVGALWIVSGALTAGVLFAFMAYEGMFLWPVRQLGRVLTDLGKAQVSLGRISEILNRPTEDGASAQASVRKPLTGEIRIRDLRFGFGGEAAVLDGVTFNVRAGQTTALLGPSGSGKSTLIHLLLRLYDYRKGSITVDGMELAALDRDFVRSQIGVVLQEPFLYSKTLRDNIKLAHDQADDESVVEAAGTAYIDESIRAFENGYDTIVGERGVTLSGGQRQRVALARAILKNPPILVLDDALSAVDTRTESLIISALRHRHGKRTTLIIAHRLSTLMHADQIVVLDRGRVAQIGTHQELVERDGLYRRLWLIQSSLEEELSKEMETG